MPDYLGKDTFKLGFGLMRLPKDADGIATTARGKAYDCVSCGQCEGACPQHLGIIDYLKQCAQRFE